MESIRCESATCYCQSEVLFHAGNGSYCSEHCASHDPGAATSCRCTHAGCDPADVETAALAVDDGTESTRPR